MKKPPSDQNRRTPLWLFSQLEQELLGGKKFQLDAAASAKNALCRKYHTEETDGLSQKWAFRTFCNPGFKRFGDWITKGWMEATDNGFTVVMIGPVGCSQVWFHRVASCGTIYAPTKRISYLDSTTGEPTKNADRDSMIYAFGHGFWNPRPPRFRVVPLEIRQ